MCFCRSKWTSLMQHLLINFLSVNIITIMLIRNALMHIMRITHVLHFSTNELELELELLQHVQKIYLQYPFGWTQVIMDNYCSDVTLICCTLASWKSYTNNNIYKVFGAKKGKKATRDCQPLFTSFSKFPNFSRGFSCFSVKNVLGFKLNTFCRTWNARRTLT